MPKFIDLTGFRFGKLTVIEQTGRTPSGRTRWLCRCECGNLSKATGSNLKNGTYGCRQCYERRASESRITHGHTSGKNLSPTYHTWAGMKARCENTNHVSYSSYGGAGIIVCERWKKFENFLVDMGDKPDGKSLDRIDNSMGYSKENCRWATPREQGVNRNTTRFLTCNGVTKSCVEWSETTGIKSATIRARLKLGWSVAEALGVDKRAPVAHASDPITGRFIKVER